MIGSGLKKLAKENGMQVSHGVAYGNFHGYTVTLSEGSGYKRMAVATHFPEAGREYALQAQMNLRNLQKEFRVQVLNVSAGGVEIVFVDNPGTMKKILAFSDWFFPLLSQFSATGAQCCTECGRELGGSGSWKLVDGTALHLHSECAQKVLSDISTEEIQKKQADTGSYGAGLVGALLGALLGAIVWALVLKLGYVASLVGLLIGWLAERGYRLLHGKQGKGKVLILIVATVFGVLLGTFGADAISLAQMIGSGELPYYTYGDIPSLISMLLSTNSEYLSATLRNIGMGLLFAFLGVFALLRQTSKEVANTKVIDLE